jgi:predicted nucleic acid-binding protein
MKYPKNIIVDTGFWIAYFDLKDSNHYNANKHSEYIFNFSVLCPFPTLYEFLNTRFSRNRKQIAEFDKLIKKIY